MQAHGPSPLVQPTMHPAVRPEAGIDMIGSGAANSAPQCILRAREMSAGLHRNESRNRSASDDNSSQYLPAPVCIALMLVHYVVMLSVDEMLISSPRTDLSLWL